MVFSGEGGDRLLPVETAKSIRRCTDESQPPFAVITVSLAPVFAAGCRAADTGASSLFLGNWKVAAK